MAIEEIEKLLRDAQVKDIFDQISFANRSAALGCLQRIATVPKVMPKLSSALRPVLQALSTAADADRALVNFERFTYKVSNPVAMWEYLHSNPRVIEKLATLFSGSQFLAEILLRNPDYLERWAQHKRLARPKTATRFLEEVQSILHSLPSDMDESLSLRQYDALRKFQRAELLRIGTCDLLGLFDLPTVVEQLSLLSDCLIRTCLKLVSEQMGVSTDGFAVIAMGKLGGEELNYSSDIDLVLIAEHSAMRFQRLSTRLIEVLGRVTEEGFLYRVDMRLRPWGRSGSLVTSLPGYVQYLRDNARDWEKQALLKARAIAGDMALGESMLEQVESHLYLASPEAVRTSVQKMKERTELQLRRRGRDWGQVKLGVGSIRDVEFIAQYFQLAHGKNNPEIRSRNTLVALRLLDEHALLTHREHRVLHDGYAFLRTIEHHLQLMHHQQSYALPEDADALLSLAARLGFANVEARDDFISRYQEHSSAIREVYRQHIEGKYGVATADAADYSIASASLQRHVARMAPSYSQTFNSMEINRHAILSSRLSKENLVEIDAVPLSEGIWRVTMVGYDYVGELSLISGLLFVYGWNIVDGHVFTYETDTGTSQGQEEDESRSKIVDVFTLKQVTSISGSTSDTVDWNEYRRELTSLMTLLETGDRETAQGALVRRVASTLRALPDESVPLYPIDIKFDNQVSARYTVLNIEAVDTVGFLYEFSNALALNGVDIVRVEVASVGDRVSDILYVTDEYGRKIVSESRLHELRAATTLVKHFTHLLPRSPNPEAALLHFRHFVAQLMERPDWPQELATLEGPRVLDALARLLGVSDFLWDDFLRMQYDNLLPVVRDVDALSGAKSRQQLQDDLGIGISTVEGLASKRKVLNAFKDRMMFRIDMRHIQGLITEFDQFSAELSDLAEVVVQAAYNLCLSELQSRFGNPLLANGNMCPLSVCALGKLGGREIGFASDIELIFIYAGGGQSSGPKVISTSEFFERFVQSFVNTIQAKREGVFEIDLQLRPYGTAGSMAVMLRAFENYFAPQGPAWDYERQALLRLRPIAGDADLGIRILNLRDDYLYNVGTSFDVAAMRAMRERQRRHQVTAGTFNAKFSLGGVVDVEYLVQALQIDHGRVYEGVRHANTSEAMRALHDVGVLSDDDFEQLNDAHQFLRLLINALRMVRGNARDLTVPPAGSDEFAFLARRLNYQINLETLASDLAEHSQNVQEINIRLLG